MVEIYTDGSCKGNPGSGGFAVIVLKDNIIDYSFTEQSEYTTNNQMELKAIIHALKYIKEHYKTEQCVIYSDSAYCVIYVIIGFMNGQVKIGKIVKMKKLKILN